MKCYLVTTGEYSAYSVEAVFTSQEKAEVFAKKFPPGREPSIEERTLDQEEFIAPNLKCYAVVITREGDIQEIEQCDPEISHSWITPYFNPGQGRTECWAKNEKQAVKIVNERRTKQLALGKWWDKWEDWRNSPEAKEV